MNRAFVEDLIRDTKAEAARLHDTPLGDGWAAVGEALEWEHQRAERLYSERERLRSLVEKLSAPPFAAFERWSRLGGTGDAEILEDWADIVIEAAATIEGLV